MKDDLIKHIAEIFNSLGLTEVKDEKVAIKAMHVAEDHVLKTKNKKRKS
ncbi:MAG: hypothetical protein GX437_12485 [Sphingobacteriales bacterium]|nr:hypothetical protein [Sphingobacteriales bacterium]